GRVPAARLEREALRDEAADPREVEEWRELGAIAERARSGQDRIAQRDAAEIHARVDAHASPSHATSRDRSTGPSRHTSAKPPLRSGAAQPRHTPKPHAIGFSSETQHTRPWRSAICAVAAIMAVGPHAYTTAPPASASAPSSRRVTSPRSPREPSS